MKTKNLINATLLAGGILLSRNVVAAGQESQPNVIVIITDDQGYGDLACHGHPFVKTPNLDTLYDQSIRFTNFHVSPCCTPTRAALLTGAYEFRSGVTHVGLGQAMLSQDSYTLAQCFLENGYQTALFGKWHLGSNYPQRPQDKGFQECLNWWGAHSGQALDYWESPGRNNPYLLHNGVWKQREGFVDDIIFADAKKWIAQQGDKPFFMFLASSSAHGPFGDCPEAYKKIYDGMGLSPDATGFYGMISLVDGRVGTLRDFLQEQQIAENTILVYMTDNGSDGALRFNQYNADMRGGKNSEDEGGTHVPCFIAWPGHLDAGRDVDQLTAHFDIFPTLADLCGLTVPKEVPMDGISLASWLRDPLKNIEQRFLFMNWGWMGPRYINPDPLKYGKCAIRNQDFRLMNGERLYDISEDVGQNLDVAKQHPELVQVLRAEYEEWWQDIRSSLLEPCFIVIGNEKENPMRLTFWDWQPSTVSSEMGGLLAGNPSYKNVPVSVRRWLNNDDNRLAPPPYMGSWAVDTDRSGRYRVQIQIVAPEANEPARLKAGTAHIRCGSSQVDVKIKLGSSSISEEIILKKGKAYLECWFDGQLPDNRPCGAFYVDVEYIGPSSSQAKDVCSEADAVWPGYCPPVLLKQGDVLLPGKPVVSHAGTCFCMLQSDGKLVVYKGSGPADNQGFIWGSGGKHPKGAYYAMLTQQGNLEIYSGKPGSQNGDPIWSSRTAGGLDRASYLNAPGVDLPDALYDKPDRPEYQVVLRDDANLWCFSGEIDHNTGIKWSLK